MNMIELFNRVKHIVQRYGELEQRNLIPNCTEKGQLCTCQYGEGWWWWWKGDQCNSIPPHLKTHLSTDIISDDKRR